MTAKSRADLKAENASVLPDNTGASISPADVRGQLDNTADSALFPGDIPGLDLSAANVTATADGTKTLAQWTADIAGGGGGSTSDAAYDVAWNGVADVSPSQNAVYDKFVLVDNAIADIAGGGTGADLAVPTPPSIYGLLDATDNAAMTMAVDGTITQSRLALTVLNSMPVAEILRRVARKPTFRSMITHFISYGQSLALGNGSGIMNLPGEFYDALMFSANGVASAGPRAQEGLGTVAQNHATLINYEERPVTGSSPGGNFDTPLGNCIRMVKRLLMAENNIQPSDFNYIILGSAPGQSNTLLSNLDKAGGISVPYQHLLDDVTYGLARAQELGKTYSVEAVFWSQGEADILGGVTRATHLSLLTQLWTDLNTDIKAITGQLHDIKMIAYQCSLEDPTNNGAISLAQLDFSLANPDKFILCTAVYACEHFLAANAHLSALGYSQLGAYFGLAYKRTVIDGETWVPFIPTSVTRQGLILDVKFPGTGYPLVIDNALFATQTNAGFTAIDGASADNPITSVSVIGPSRVKVVLTNAVAGTLRYGFSATGAQWGGNLRDSNPLDIQAARRRPLYAPCLIFEKTFT